jgi:hypothetical protein
VRMDLSPVESIAQRPLFITHFRFSEGRRIRGVFSSWVLLHWTSKEEVPRPQGESL